MPAAVHRCSGGFAGGGDWQRQALETGMELTLVLHTATTNGKIAVSYPAELELLETQTGFGDEVLWDVDPAKRVSSPWPGSAPRTSPLRPRP